MPAKKKSEASPNLHFVTGTDEAAVKKAAAGLAAKLAPSDDPMATEVIDGSASTSDEAASRIASTIEAILTLPFFGGDKLVWLKSATFFSDTVTGRSETVAKAVDRLLAQCETGLPDGVTLLISAADPDKRRTAYKTLSKIANLHLHDKPDFGWGATEADVVDWVARRVNERGLRLHPDALDTLAARVGAETGQLDSEMEKLALAFPEGSEISEADVRLFVPATRAGGIFDLGNALAKRDLPLALVTLEQLIRQGERAIGILLAAVVPTIRNLLLAKDLMDQHGIKPPTEARYFSSALSRLGPDETAHLPRKKDGSLNTYSLGLAAMNARRFSLSELERAWEACARANRDLVSTQLSEEIVLSRLVVSVAGKSQSA